MKGRTDQYFSTNKQKPSPFDAFSVCIPMYRVLDNLILQGSAFGANEDPVEITEGMLKPASTGGAILIPKLSMKTAMIMEFLQSPSNKIV